MTYVLALVTFSYLAFVFISDQFNPFAIARAPLKRRRWRLGRAAALSSLVAGSIGLCVWLLNFADQRVALGLSLIMASIFILPAVIKYKKSALWQ